MATLCRTTKLLLNRRSVPCMNAVKQYHFCTVYQQHQLPSHKQISQNTTLTNQQPTLQSITEKLKENNMKPLDAANTLTKLQTVATKKDWDVLQHDPGFKNLCDVIGKGCPNFMNGSLINCLKNVLITGINPQSYVVKSLETEVLWRLRKFSQRQLAALLAFHVDYKNTELQAQVVQETVQTIQRRWVEVDSIRDVNTLFELKNNFSDEFLRKLEDRALETMEKASVDEISKMFVVLAKHKHRPPFVLRSMSFHLAKQSQKLTSKQAANIMCAMNALNFPDQVLLERLSTDLVAVSEAVKTPTVVAAILTSIGQLRWKHMELLDMLSEWVSKNLQNCKPKILVSYLLTSAMLNYKPHNSEELLTGILEQFKKTSAELLPNVWIDVVWSLIVHEKATEENLASVLNPKFAEHVKNASTKIKLSLVNAFAKYYCPSYKGPYLNWTVHDVSIPLNRDTERQNKAVTDALANFLPRGKFIVMDKIVAECILINAEIVVDSNAKPLSIKDHTEILNAGQPKPTPAGIYKLAVIVRNFKDYTIGLEELNGLSIIKKRLLEKLGYTMVEVSLPEFTSLSNTLSKVQYLQKLITDSIATAKAVEKTQKKL